MNLFKNFTGIILAGGASSRMGQNKADLLLSGKTLIQHQIDKLHNAGINNIFLSGYANPLPGTRYVADIIGRKGPVSGIHACLSEAKTPYCLVISVDVPLVPVNILQDLMQQHIYSNNKISILKHSGKSEPLIGVYNTELSHEALDVLQSGDTSVRSLLSKCGHNEVPYFGDEALLLNCNTPEDFEIISKKFSSKDKQRRKQ